MLKVHSERINSCFDGTIIDVESFGGFCRGFGDSREYKDIVPTIFGYINCKELHVLCAMGKPALNELTLRINKLLPVLERPFFAFNCNFEQGVLHHSCSERVIFDGELNQEKYEPKWRAVKTLGIPNHNDPFFDDGSKCMASWLNGDYESSILHNRSCLLKERDILLKRSFRKPDELKLFEIKNL
jgi:hypothetical protein